MRLQSAAKDRQGSVPLTGKDFIMNSFETETLNGILESRRDKHQAMERPGFLFWSSSTRLVPRGPKQSEHRDSRVRTRHADTWAVLLVCHGNLLLRP
ncbi:hypothetical protein ElyMa_002260700 [Elysia marginata]|uniref:Uncharacterized protein n=1 Tax=Elysia marginata TaxID=1093978 RepID=A0AAV4G1F8_9GAST|nr:hypothetical protein ElyMa_002260700 [Elysia marginata]